MSDRQTRPEKIRHTLADMIGQRIFGIACGHPDGNDADHLADDPIHKLLLDFGSDLAQYVVVNRRSLHNIWQS